MTIEPAVGTWQQRCYYIIFQSDTPAGRIFDITLLVLILTSVGLVAAESVPGMREQYGDELHAAEWICTIIFTIEYALRCWCVKKTRSYVFSYYGLVDLVSVIPTWLLLVTVNAQVMLMVRILRLMRVFRILKLSRYVGESQILWKALRSSRQKIIVFLFAVICMVVLVGTAMFVIEGPQHGFSSIPISMYWAIVTMTTVGFGDIVPQTGLGRGLASILMVTGYGIIAVPTGIVSAELVQAKHSQRRRTCLACGHKDHDEDAIYCKVCGGELPEQG
ncbi:MAG: ion transporter [Sphaerospermopsis sp. SIO1G2]|nr:ion transporter [Sphaerospermopsis sp. SIO1G2]